MTKRTAVATSLFTSAALIFAGCRPHPTPTKPPQSCAPQKQRAAQVQGASAHTTVGGADFTVDASLMLSAGQRDSTGNSEGHWLVQRNSVPVLQIDTQTTALGALQVRVLLGAGFHGPKEVILTSEDHATLGGSVDGRPLAPFPVRTPTANIKFADNSAIPGGTIDDDVRQALPILMRSIQTQCAPPEPGQPVRPRNAPRLPDADPPGHYSDTLGTPGCIGCLAGSSAGEVACVAVAAIAALSCVILYAVCLAAGIATCVIAYLIALCTGCHVAEFPSCGGGGPCCPVDCVKDFCCDVGETCVGPNGLCCSPGLKGCGTENCCLPTDTCMQNGTCCGAGHNVCNGVCCPGANDVCNPNTQACCAAGTVCGNTCCKANQTCVNSSSSTCCASVHACGSVCCANSESCTDPNRGTCAACANCSGPNQDCCFGQCCTEPNYCDLGTHACKCRPNCDGKCGGASDGCGGICDSGCPEFQVCYNQRCCVPDCTGKCGGAPDGCGGTCTRCPVGETCTGQSCCAPNCANKACGAPDGCGGTCAGFCQDGTCSPQHKCIPNCPPGRADCCGDGSCCLIGSQCYKCSCEH